MIWIIGGTKDSRNFVEKILCYENISKEDIIVSTATAYGEELIKNTGVKISARRMEENEMKNFILKNQVSLIVDLSHPYAYNVSLNAIKISKELDIKYYRFERPELNLEVKNVIYFDDLKKITDFISNLEGNVLVTLGSNSIDEFKHLKNLKNIFFRVLPKSEVIKKCEESGILAKNIIAMQGPFTKDLNIATMKQFNIKYLVSKKSGDVGGEKEKVEACDYLDVSLIYYEKKEIDYPNCYTDISLLINDIFMK